MYTLLLFPLQCNEAYSSSDTLLTEGFGGTTVLTCRLQELNALTLTLNRRKRESNETASDDQGAGNSNSTEENTNSTTTTTPKSTTTSKPVSTKAVNNIRVCYQYKIKKYMVKIIIYRMKLSTKGFFILLFSNLYERILYYIVFTIRLFCKDFQNYCKAPFYNI